jgi:hypothetical protein
MHFQSLAVGFLAPGRPLCQTPLLQPVHSHNTTPRLSIFMPRFKPDGSVRIDAVELPEQERHASSQERPGSRKRQLGRALAGGCA